MIGCGCCWTGASQPGERRDRGRRPTEMMDFAHEGLNEGSSIITAQWEMMNPPRWETGSVKDNQPHTGCHCWADLMSNSKMCSELAGWYSHQRLKSERGVLQYVRDKCWRGEKHHKFRMNFGGVIMERAFTKHRNSLFEFVNIKEHRDW